MAKHEAVTDLEGAMLGLLARGGPMTGYAISRAFAASPSAFWSGSSGAIYPLTRRLLERKLIAGKATANGKREATEYDLTATGRAAFRAWLLDADRAADMGFDPLRTRLFFLHLASPAQRAQFLEAVEDKTAELSSDEAQASEPPEDRPINRAWLRHRLAWIKGLKARS